MPERVFVVLNYQDDGSTARLVERLLGEHAEPDELLVVDNASPDGSGARLAAAFPTVEHLQLDTNRGFAGGMNHGLARARERGATFAILVNDDLEPLPGLFAELEGAARARPDAAVVGAVIHGDERRETIHHAAEMLPAWTLHARHRLPLPTPEDPLLECDWVSGAAMLLRLEVLDEVGALDEDFFMYWEETELCARARAAGWKVLCAPAARAVHRDRGTDVEARLPRYLLARNRWLYLRKVCPWYCWPSAVLYTLFDALRGALGLLRRGAGTWRLVLQGALDGMRGRRGPPPAELIPGAPAPGP